MEPIGLTSQEGMQVVGGRPLPSQAPGSRATTLLPVPDALNAAFSEATDRLFGPEGSALELLASPLPGAASSGYLLVSPTGEVDFGKLGGSPQEPVTLTLLQGGPAGPAVGTCPAPSCQYQPLKGGATPKA